MNKAPYWIEFKSVGEKGIGYISVAENSKIPFPIKRVYWTYYTPNEVERGNHAHKFLEQIIIAVSGNIIFEIEGPARTLQTYTLNSPSKGLYIPPLHWRKIRFSHNAVLLCLASLEYEADDYIRYYEDFQSYLK